MAGLPDFLNFLRGRQQQQQGEISKGKTQIDPSKHFVTTDDFYDLAETFLAYLPDPDEVLKKLGVGVGIYRQTLTDAHVAGCILQRKSRTKRQELVILAGDPEDAQSQKARDLVQDQIDKIKRMPNVISEILNAPYFGMSPLELFWNTMPTNEKRPTGEVILENIMEKPFEWFGFTKEGELGIKDRLGSTFYNLRPIPTGKFVNVVKDGTYKNPYGDRAAKRVYWPWLFKKGGFRFWTEFVEKYGMPFLFGKLDPKKSQDDLTEFHNVLAAMVRNGIVVSKTSGDDTIDVVESQSRGSSTDTYKRYKDGMNIEISKAILGETLTIENSESGSQAATRIHKEVLEAIQDEDKSMAESALDEVFELITHYNFPPEVKPPYASLIDTHELSENVAKRDKILYVDLGVRFKKEYIAKTYQIEEDDFELAAEPLAPEEEQTAPSGGAPGAGPVKPEEEEKATGGTAFAEAFGIQDGIDNYIESTLGKITGLTVELRQKIRDIIKNSEDYNEFIIKMSLLHDQVDNKIFARVFDEALNVASIVGEWAVNNDKL